MKLFESKSSVKAGKLLNGQKFKFQKSDTVYIRVGSFSYNMVLYTEFGKTEQYSTHFDTKVIPV